MIVIFRYLFYLPYIGKSFVFYRIAFIQHRNEQCGLQLVYPKFKHGPHISWNENYVDMIYPNLKRRKKDVLMTFVSLSYFLNSSFFLYTSEFSMATLIADLYCTFLLRGQQKHASGCEIFWLDKWRSAAVICSFVGLLSLWHITPFPSQF